MVAAYRPCKSDGPLTTYQQQLRYWYKHKQTKCPKTLFLNNLAKEIQQWQEEGDKVIVLADMNEDVLAPEINKFCQATHMVEAIAALHGKSPMPTHQCGSRAIDGIFLSHSLLEDAKGRFLEFGEVTVSNHRAVWIDIPKHHFDMTEMADITRAVGRRLKCQDPRIMTKYNQFLVKVVEQE